MAELVPVILSGGSGTRLWPISRERHPKQLQPLIDGDSLLQATVRRLEGLDAAAPVVVSNEEYRFITAEQLRALGLSKWYLLLEPVGRNTAPALTAAALFAMQGGSDPLLLATPADHHIDHTEAFHVAIRAGMAEAERGAVVTFGIAPSRAETGYGYMETRSSQSGMGTAAHDLLAFREKPDAETAANYVESGRYYWNSGIFLLRASVWLHAIEALAPEILAACRDAVGGARTDGDFVRLEAKAFASSPADSIDYSVMEKLPVSGLGVPCKVVPLVADWSDVGAWDALWEAMGHDAAGNALRGDVIVEGGKDNLVIAEHRLVTCIGCEDMVVVETADAVLVVPRRRTQDVRRIVARLKAAGRGEVEAHRKVHRPWGWYDGIDHGERFQVKRIVVRPGASLSLQLHHHRAEHWVVVRGAARVTRGDDLFVLGENESTYIPPGVKHRLENPGRIPLEMIEVQSGAYLGEDDIVRFDDDYGR